MRASYRRFDGTNGELDRPVILAQANESTGGFILLGFESWESVNDEKISNAIADVVEFHINENKIGFRD